MTSQGPDGSPGTFKVTCKNYPPEFVLDKNVAKEYFKQFGKIKRMIFKPKQRVCTVEYTSKQGFLNALNRAGEYKGNFFKVSVEKSPDKKKKVVDTGPIWVDADDIEAELEAMSGTAPKTYLLPEVIDLTDSFTEAPKVVPKLKRPRSTEALPKIKKKTRTREKSHAVISPEQLELINIIKSQASTIEEKYKVLDARDKLIRIKLKQSAQVKSSPTVGSCPDMCPEKERLMRETQHQVALYEQEENGKAMNQSKAVKQYSRSSADQEAPLPHELRPVSVLQMTMGYLMHNIINLCDNIDVNLAEWFHFLWDRTRGIRKDITQQELCCQGAVELVEQCARFHIHCSARLVGEDPSVFDQKINTENLTKCLQTLKYMYHDLQLKGESCPNEAEFRAYIILLNLNDGNFMWEVQELREDIQKSQEVKFALQVYSALDKSNYVKFFKLVYSTTYLNACLLMRYFVQVRVTAVKTLLKCYKPRALKTIYPLGELTQILAFDDVESTMDFMQTYGLAINKEKTHVILENTTVNLPEFPYVLDRSLNVVECKRQGSVGEIVCGKELPSKTYENHFPQNSFDHRGYLNIKGVLDEADLEAPKLAMVVDLVEDSGSGDVEMVQPNITSRISAPKDTQVEQKLTATSLKAATGSIFGQGDVQKSYFSRDPRIYTKTRDETDSVAKLPQSEPKLWTAPPQSFQTTDSIFAKAIPKTSSIFGGNVAKELPKVAAPTTAPKKGGFVFNLPLPTPKANVSSSFIASQFFPPMIEQNKVPMESMKMPITPEEPFSQPTIVEVTEDLEEIQRKKEEEEEEKLRRELEEQQRRKKLEKKLLEERKKEEERLKTIKRMKQEEELRRKMEALRREEQKRKDLEIREAVKTVLANVVNAVDEKISREVLRRIRNKIQRRLMLKITQNWREIVYKNKKQRKAMDCSPVWVNTKTPEQSAQELRTASQDLTLGLMKRYRYGKSLNIAPIEDDKISKINLSQLTYATLNKRFFDLKGTLQKNIFWKVEVSLPDHYELSNGLSKIEDTLKAAFCWEDKDGTIMFVEQAKPNPSQSITYCVERQRGLFVRYADANGIIFIAKDFNALLQRRIFENLKLFGVFTKVPIVIILQHYDDIAQSKLKALIEEKIVSDYIILIDNLTPLTLVNLVEEGLVFLASKVEKQPPLELDTLSSFITKSLCTEIWKRANSFAKWNSQYKTCLRNPNIVISLYNEGLAKLKKIALNKSCYEYASFPEVFKDFLENEIPAYLPCNYYYFPKFWKNEAYTAHVEKILKTLALPKWLDKWPPSNELELEVNVSKYCTKMFKEPEKPFYRFMSVLLRNVDPNANFEDINKVLWTDVVEVLGLEKLRQANLSLTGTVFENKSIFNQFVVIYDVDSLENYNKSDWFYINNPLVKKHVKHQLKKETNAQNDRPEPKLDLSLSVDLDKTISEITNQLLNRENNLQMKKELEEFNALMDDLETSIKIHKKISSKFEENLRDAIEYK